VKWFNVTDCLMIAAHHNK